MYSLTIEFFFLSFLLWIHCMCVCEVCELRIWNKKVTIKFSPCGFMNKIEFVRKSDFSIARFTFFAFLLQNIFFGQKEFSHYIIMFFPLRFHDWIISESELLLEMEIPLYFRLISLTHLLDVTKKKKKVKWEGNSQENKI